MDHLLQQIKLTHRGIKPQFRVLEMAMHQHIRLINQAKEEYDSDPSASNWLKVQDSYAVGAYILAVGGQLQDDTRIYVDAMTGNEGKWIRIGAKQVKNWVRLAAVIGESIVGSNDFRYVFILLYLTLLEKSALLEDETITAVNRLDECHPEWRVIRDNQQAMSIIDSAGILTERARIRMAEDRLAYG